MPSKRSESNLTQYSGVTKNNGLMDSTFRAEFKSVSLGEYTTAAHASIVRESYIACYKAGMVLDKEVADFYQGELKTHWSNAHGKKGNNRKRMLKWIFDTVIRFSIKYKTKDFLTCIGTDMYEQYFVDNPTLRSRSGVT